MPKVNLPLGIFGIFIPAIDPSIVVIPAVDPSVGSPGIYTKRVVTSAYVNLTRFLQQVAAGPNATLGGLFDANQFTSFDVVFGGATVGTTITPVMYETLYSNGVPTVVKNASNTPAFVISPVPPAPTLPTPANSSSVAKFSLADYWLLGQNGSEVTDVLELDVSAAIQLVGVQIYFGNKQ